MGVRVRTEIATKVRVRVYETIWSYSVGVRVGFEIRVRVHKGESQGLDDSLIRMWIRIWE